MQLSRKNKPGEDIQKLHTKETGSANKSSEADTSDSVSETPEEEMLEKQWETNEKEKEDHLRKLVGGVQSLKRFCKKCNNLQREIRDGLEAAEDTLDLASRSRRAWKRTRTNLQTITDKRREQPPMMNANMEDSIDTAANKRALRTAQKRSLNQDPQSTLASKRKRNRKGNHTPSPKVTHVTHLRPGRKKPRENGGEWQEVRNWYPKARQILNVISHRRSPRGPVANERLGQYTDVCDPKQSLSSLPREQAMQRCLKISVAK